MLPIEPSRAIRREFVTNYQLDELPAWTEENLRGELRRRTWASAVRLREMVSPERLPEVIELLRAMREDPHHPLLAEIEVSTMMIWSDEPADWQVFQLLVDRIIDELLHPSNTPPAAR
jgi:hypothetical protein